MSEHAENAKYAGYLDPASACPPEESVQNPEPPDMYDPCILARIVSTGK